MIRNINNAASRIFLCIGLYFALNIPTSPAQTYFPAKFSKTWDTLSPQRFGWCDNRIDSLYKLLDDGNSKGFILLKEGKIVLEKYFNGHTVDSTWYWASAGKSMTTFMVGLAQEQGKLKITDSTSKYLGTGWTNETSVQEGKITVLNQLTMTSGLNDLFGDCTTPNCLVYKADPDARWAYHNAPYTLLDQVVENATGQSYNTYFQQQITLKTGITGLWFRSGFNNVLGSNTRSMARYGLLIQNNGIWDGDTIMHDRAFFNKMVATSQSINKSYGYLWWLNGKSSYMLPGSQTVFNGSIVPNAPNDMFAGIGKNGQYCCIIPSQNMVVIRMGESPDSALVPTDFINKMFGKINELSCATFIKNAANNEFKIYPNPSNGILNIDIASNESQTITVFSSCGKLLQTLSSIKTNFQLDLSEYPKGIYFIKIGATVQKILVN
mgnify:CR=1 FL=1